MKFKLLIRMNQFVAIPFSRNGILGKHNILSGFFDIRIYKKKKKSSCARLNYYKLCSQRILPLFYFLFSVNVDIVILKISSVENDVGLYHSWPLKLIVITF